MGYIDHPAPYIACASEQVERAGDPGDPAERTNRRLYAFHDLLDRALIRPIAVFYSRVFPRPIRTAVRHAVQNLDEPGIVINDALQLRPTPAASATVRFALNSTLGIVGLFDVATPMGVHRHDNDFGLTLARHGVGAGPYVFIPVIGPSTVRDAVGIGVDFAVDPLNWLTFRHSSQVLDSSVVLGALDDRAEIDADLKSLEATAADPYASIRSVYLQSRAAEVSGDAGPAPLPDVPDDDPMATPEPDDTQQQPAPQGPPGSPP